MPTTMYNIIQRSSYPVIVGKAIYPKYFTTYDQVAIMDYRNPLVQKYMIQSCVCLRNIWKKKYKLLVL